LKRALLVVVAMTARAHADDTVAATAFNQAAAFEAQGKWAEACPLYETSYRADPQIGVLLHLAICHEQIGKLASAWSEFTDAADLAKSRHDPREQTARDRANALAPKLAKLYIAPPSQPIAGMVVKRDGVDVTALVGTQAPIDTGDHTIELAAPGYLPWTKTVTIAAQATATVDLPLLQKAPEPPPEVHEGTLIVTAPDGAQISLDQQPVGVGHFEGKVSSKGGHTLRVTAPGMRPYQSEVVVADNASRTIDVPFDKDVVVVAEPHDELPAFELGAGLASGVKLRGDDPLVMAIRAEAAFRFGRRVNFGLFVEYGAIDTGNACGFSMPGAIPETPFDFGPRNQFQSCRYVMPGLQLYIHVLPKRTFDPYIGVTPGFRFGFVDWVPYVGGLRGMETSDVFPAIVSGVRAGLDYHPKSDYFAWEVGAWFETSITIFGQEASHNDNNGSSKNDSGFVSLLGGLRTTLQF
jgi:hypothetical protein